MVNSPFKAVARPGVSSLTLPVSVDAAAEYWHWDIGHLEDTTVRSNLSTKIVFLLLSYKSNWSRGSIQIIKKNKTINSTGLCSLQWPSVCLCACSPTRILKQYYLKNSVLEKCFRAWQKNIQNNFSTLSNICAPCHPAPQMCLLAVLRCVMRRHKSGKQPLNNWSTDIRMI